MVVPAYQMADKELVDRWITYVRGGGNLILSCRTAQKDRFGRLPEMPFGHMLTPLTGCRMEFFDLLLPHDPGTLSMNGKEYRWSTWGEILDPSADCKILATYSSEFYKGKPVVVTRKLGKGTVTYVGTDSSDGSLERDILKSVYADAEISVMDLPYGVTMEYRDGFGIVLNYMDKPYSFELPEGATALIGNTEIPSCGVLVFKVGK